MDKKPSIALGPILGIEGNNEYTATVILEREIDAYDLSLIIVADAENCVELHYDDVEPLHSKSLYRFAFSLPSRTETYTVKYHLKIRGQIISNKCGDSDWTFVVPGKFTVPKIGFGSCNGSSSKHPSKLGSNDYAMWKRLFEEHNRDGTSYSFHALVLAGDQVYADTLWDCVAYFSQNRLFGFWRNSTDRVAKHKIADEDRHRLTSELETFYENLYIESWGKVEISRVLASIPSLMIWDDHDIIDGWGSQPRKLQDSEIFKMIGDISKKYFEAFQIRTRNNKNLFSNTHYSQHITFRNFEIFALDNRSNRSENTIMSAAQYSELEAIKDEGRLFGDCPTSLDGQKVILFVLPVPIAHLNYKARTERWLRWIFSWNFRWSLNDDGLDHWDHQAHEVEQKKMIDLIYGFGDRYHPKYVHVASGDVHSAGAGLIVRTQGEKRFVNQLISSGIVHKSACKIAQLLMKLVSRDTSQIEGYSIAISRFGVKKYAPKTYFDRNYGALYKAEKSGLKFYLTFESKDGYSWHQPNQYIPSKKEASRDYDSNPPNIKYEEMKEL